MAINQSVYVRARPRDDERVHGAAHVDATTPRAMPDREDAWELLERDARVAASRETRAEGRERKDGDIMEDSDGRRRRDDGSTRRRRRSRDRSERWSGSDDDGGRNDRGRRGRGRRSRSESRDRDGRRGRDGDGRGRRRRRDDSRDRERLSTPEREEELERKRQEREAERQKREMEKLDRDTRTVFVTNLSTKLDERGIFKFFSEAGKVTDVRIIYDRNSTTSKGMAYVEFSDRKFIHPALECTGMELHGNAISVKTSEAEKNIAWEAEQAQKKKLGAAYGAAVYGAGGGAGPCKLRVGGLHLALSEDDIKAVFEPFGQLDFISMLKEDDGKYASAFVQFRQTSHAMLALSQLNGLELVGIPIRVSIASQGATAAASTMVAPTESLGELDEDGGGLKMDSRGRAALMARLAGQDKEIEKGFTIDPATGLPTTVDAIKPIDAPGEDLPLAAQPITQGVLGPCSPIPTPCLLLKNLFNAAEETDPEWWLDIAEDVKGECEKFGEITHTFVDKDRQGFVYLKFADVASSTRAQQALHTRWFAGRKIAAEYQFTATYNGHFGLSK